MRFVLSPVNFSKKLSVDKMSENLAENHSCSSVQSVGEKTPKVSVIVPVYKVEKYLPECIDSILAQTFTDFELILVDDGSPDNSGKICDDYAARDSRIRVFHKENGGVTSARRLGVENARGEWVMFVDGDDVLLALALEVLILFVSPHVDLVEGELATQNDPILTREWSHHIVDGLGYGEAIRKGVFGGGPWKKIVRKSLFFVPPLPLSIPRWMVYGEDTLMNFRIATKIRSAVKVNAPVYHLRIRNESATKIFRMSMAYLLAWGGELKGLAKNDCWESVINRFWVHFCANTFPDVYALAEDFDSNNPKMKEVISELLLLKSPSRKLRFCLLPFRYPFLRIFRFDMLVYWYCRVRRVLGNFKRLLFT